MATRFSVGRIRFLKVTPEKPKKFTLALRRPYWAGAGFSVKVNGHALKHAAARRIPTWKLRGSGSATRDHSHAAKNAPHRATAGQSAALRGDVGAPGAGGRPVRKCTVEKGRRRKFSGAKRSRDGRRRDAGGEMAKAHSRKTGRVSLRWRRTRLRCPLRSVLPIAAPPLCNLLGLVHSRGMGEEIGGAHRRRRAAKKARRRDRGFPQPGQMQAERDANEQGEETSPIQLEGHYGRQGKKWFSFDLPADTTQPLIVLVTYSNDARRDTLFDVLVEGQKIGEHRTERKSPEKPVRFFDVEYAVPLALVAGKQKITLRFEAHGENEISGVFGVRLIRADIAR